jgi:3'-5' exoribonuclease
MFLDQHGEKFRRTAAARKNHHARRGGMIEHVAQMMRSAVAISSVYPELNQDLLIAGVLFHDSGKLWENSYAERGFTQPYDMQGEMLGHIPLGISLVDKLWEQMISSCVETAEVWGKLTPSNDEVRIHLLHLVASHHGTHEFGSPTLPRTPEAQILHHIDNIDAKFEMMKQAYKSAPELAPDIQERQFPLPANLIKPLAHITPEMAKANAFIEQAEEKKASDNDLDLF